MCSRTRAMSDPKGIGNVLREGIVCSSLWKPDSKIPGSSFWLRHLCSQDGKGQDSASKNYRHYLPPPPPIFWHNSTNLVNVLSLFSFVSDLSLGKVLEKILKQGGEALGSIGFFIQRTSESK